MTTSQRTTFSVIDDHFCLYSFKVRKLKLQQFILWRTGISLPNFTTNHLIVVEIDNLMVALKEKPAVHQSQVKSNKTSDPKSPPLASGSYDGHFLDRIKIQYI